MAYTIKGNLKRISEQLKLTELDVILLELYYSTEHDKTAELSDSILKIVEQKAMFQAQNKVRNTIKKRIWESGSIQLLKAIHYQIKYNIGFIEEQFEVLPKDILPRLSSFDKIKSSDPRSEIAKTLGATIIA